MSFQIASAFVDITARDNTSAGVVKATENVGKSMEAAGGKAEGTFKTMLHGLAPIGGAVAGAFAVDKVTEFFKTSMEQARDSQKINAQTAAVLKSTGGAANITSDGIRELSKSISEKTAIDDDQIQSSANMLLTFTGVRNEVGKGNDIFNQATQTITDMSVALGQDGKSSAIQLGKALNDPIKGITALQRVGVSFTDQQKKQIDTLVKGGKTLDAQKIILHELNKEFGGSAAAQATGADKMKLAWQDFQKQVGGYLIPILDKLETFIADKVLPGAMKLGGYIGSTLTPVFSAVKPVLGMVTDAFKELFGGFTGNEAVVDGIQGWREAIYTFGMDARMVIDWFVGIVKGLFDGSATGGSNGFITRIKGIGSAFGGLVDSVKHYVSVILPIYEKIAGTLVELFKKYEPKIKQILEQVLDVVKGAIQVASAVISKLAAVIQFIWNHAGQQILNVVRIVFGTVVKVIHDALTVVQGVIDVVLGILTGKWGKAWDGIKKIVSGVWDGIKALVSGAIRATLQIIQGELNVIGGVFSKVWNGIVKGLSSAWSGIVNTAKNFIGQLVSAIGSIPGKIASFGGAVLNAGKNLMQSMWNGIKGAASGAANFVGNVVSDIGSGIKNALNDVLHLPWVLPQFKIGAFGHYVHIGGETLFPRLATGGWVNGPGSATSDSIPTMLSNGEFVVNARSAAANKGLLEAINSGKAFVGSSGGNTYVIENVTIDAKTVAEMNSVIDFFNSAEQMVRSKRGATYKRGF